MGIDARGGRVAIAGWTETTEIGVVELAGAEGLATVVPASPEWTVKDVVAHVAGLASEAVAGTVPPIDPLEQWRDSTAATAMTGHQVYSTLHTNTAIGAIPRLVDIGLSPEIIAGNIIGVIAQRLVRRLCRHCRQPYAANPAECRLLGVKPEGKAPTLYRAVGCDHCDYQGYRGRLAIMELLRLDGELDEMVAHRATPRELHKAALAKGFRTLADDGSRRVLDGSTSLDELQRVVDLTDRM